MSEGMFAQAHRDLFLYLTWLGLLVGAAVVILSAPTRFADSALFVAMAEAELGLLFLAWPLWLSRALRECTTPRDAAARALLQAVALWVLAFPVNLVAQAMSNAEPSAFFETLALLAGTTLLVATFHVWARAMNWTLHPYYFMGVFATQALLPYAGYVALRLTDGESLATLRILSPFWSAAAGAGALGCAAVLLGVSGAVAAAVPWRKAPPK